LLSGSRSVDADALQSTGATAKLAHELASEGHLVQVIVSDPSLLPDQKSQGLNERVCYHLVDPERRTEFTGRFMKASPAANEALKQALQHWQKVVELNSQEPFDVLDTGNSLLSALMPGMCRLVPTVCSAHDKMAILKESHSLFVPLPFETQLLAMLERMALNLVDRVAVPSPQLEQRLQGKVSAITKKIDWSVAVQSTAGKVAQYKKAIEGARPSSKVYLKASSDLTADALMIFKAYDEMIYNFLYQNSYRFRIYHWWQMFRSNPALFQSKLKRALGSGQ